jgi:hypothetical protein
MPQATEKPKAAAPQTKAPSQESQEQAVQEAPQVEIAPELQQRIGVKTVKAMPSNPFRKLSGRWGESK